MTKREVQSNVILLQELGTSSQYGVRSGKAAMHFDALCTLPDGERTHVRHAAAPWLKTPAPDQKPDPLNSFDRHCFAWVLRPSLQRVPAGLGQAVNSTLDAIEPSIDIVKKDSSGVRILSSEIPHATWTCNHRGRATQRLLAIRCHDRRPRAAAGDRIALAALMLDDQAGALFRIAARTDSEGATNISTLPSCVTPSIPNPSLRHRLR
mgnify:CR=1 FL=1